MADTSIAVQLAEARGVAEWSAGELHTLLTVYGSQLPAEVARSLTKMQASLAAVADGAGGYIVVDRLTDPPMPLVGPMTWAECEAWIIANPGEGDPGTLAVVPMRDVTS